MNVLSGELTGNVRCGSLADLFTNTSLMSDSEGKAAVHR